MVPQIQARRRCSTGMLASWLSFGTARRRGSSPAILGKALIRPCLAYPLASFDVSGQWLIYHTAASPNEVSILHRYYTRFRRESQE